MDAETYLDTTNGRLPLKVAITQVVYQAISIRSYRRFGANF